MYKRQVVERVPLVMNPGEHNASYLKTKERKLGHLLTGPGALVGWHASDGPRRRRDLELLQQLEQLSSGFGLQIEAEDHHRVLAVLGQPALCLRLKALDGSDIKAGSLQLLRHLAARIDTGSLQLLLGPDLQRSEHPPADLEPTCCTLETLRDGDEVSSPTIDQGPEVAPLWSLTRWN